MSPCRKGWSFMLPAWRDACQMLIVLLCVAEEGQAPSNTVTCQARCCYASVRVDRLWYAVPLVVFGASVLTPRAHGDGAGRGQPACGDVLDPGVRCEPQISLCSQAPNRMRAQPERDRRPSEARGRIQGVLHVVALAQETSGSQRGPLRQGNSLPMECA